MERLRHLFFVRSDFHYILCKAIIDKRHLNKEECFFVCGRGVRVGADDKECDVYRRDIVNIYDRFRYYIINKKRINDFFSGYDVIAYTPFNLLFPRHLYVKDIVLFEEGFSAYCAKKKDKEKNIISRIKGLISNYLITSVLSLVKKQSRCYIKLYRDVSNVPTKNTTLYTCSPLAYSVFCHQLLIKDTVSINGVFFQEKYQPSSRYIIVLDRFSEKGRVYSLSTYKSCILQMLDFCIKNGEKNVLVKFHPADWNNADAERILMDCIKISNINIHVFKGRLELLALQNIGMVFLGTNSTILYYAPQLGETNRSYSFSKYMAEQDPMYAHFLNLFGGVNSFISKFSRFVKCV